MAFNADLSEADRQPDEAKASGRKVAENIGGLVLVRRRFFVTSAVYR